ncbi:helix-turn-helix domain-containing protein [Mycobacteroides abscessus]|uniref:helix-turn-helix domain-containing protein n=1 Tax=Mycobacteroides abscessus TaxID=36809 RepID=UPI0009A89E37|nr:helix-turn-helix domain-containing protein [Mycobacteroides abscessus]
MPMIKETIQPATTQASTSLYADLAAAIGQAKTVDVAADGDTIHRLPHELADLLRTVAQALHEGLAVSVTAVYPILSTSEAAEILGVSRPTFVKILDAGEIPYTSPGRHRRVKLDDVLAYRDRTAHERAAILEEMAEESAEDDAYRKFNGIIETR